MTGSMDVLNMEPCQGQNPIYLSVKKVSLQNNIMLFLWLKKVMVKQVANKRRKVEGNLLCRWEELEKSLAEEFSYIEPYSHVTLLDNTCTVGELLEEPSEGIIETNNAPANMPEPVSEASVNSFQQSSSSVATLNALEEMA